MSFSRRQVLAGAAGFNGDGAGQYAQAGDFQPHLGRGKAAVVFVALEIKLCCVGGTLTTLPGPVRCTTWCVLYRIDAVPQQNQLYNRVYFGRPRDNLVSF